VNRAQFVPLGGMTRSLTLQQPCQNLYLLSSTHEHKITQWTVS